MEAGGGQPASPAASPSPSPGSPLQLTPVLAEVQIARLAEAAQCLAQRLPLLEPKALNIKKKMSKELEHLLTMPEDDPRRMDLVRKYAAIYGRFDCKRKPEKPLTLHEVSVNEAAAQICRFVPPLLTRRDELFPLARQVVRDSGYHYSKGHSKSYSLSRGSGSFNNGDHCNSKRLRLDSSCGMAEEDPIRLRRQERLDQIADELRSVAERTEELMGSSSRSAGSPVLRHQMEALQNRQSQLLVEQNELIKDNHPQSNRYSGGISRVSSGLDCDRPDTDDTDSQFSFSNASSPSQEISDSRDSVPRESESADVKSPSKGGQATSGQESDDEIQTSTEMDAVPSKDYSSSNYEESFYHENKVKVIASSGGNIIAVANPALSMSPAISLVNATMLKRERHSPLTSLNAN